MGKELITMSEQNKIEQNKIDEIKARMMAITPGSWHVQPGSPYDAVYSSQETSLTVVASRTMTSDAWFIAKSPEYITYLLQEIERLKEQNERKDEALEFYAHPINWVGYKSEHSGDYYRPSVLDDGGKRAREAL